MPCRAMLMVVAALALCIGKSFAEPPTIRSSAADDQGAAARACLTLARTPSAKPDAHVGDFVSIEPAAQTAIAIADDQLCLGGLAYGTRYTVTVRPGLPFDDGSHLDAAAATTVDTPDRAPLVAMGGRGWIVPRRNATGVAVQTVNVDRLRIRVLRMSAPKLVSSIGQPDRSPLGRVDPSRESFSISDLTELLDGQATEIWNGTMAVRAARNQTVETAVPLASLIDPAKPGAYVVLAENASKPTLDLSPNRHWNEGDWTIGVPGRWVLVTDLAVSSVLGKDGLRATVRSLDGATPLAGAQVELVSVAQDTLATATTDANGEALIAPGLLRGKFGAAPSALVVRTDRDMAVQDLKTPAFDLSDRGAEGREAPGAIEAFVYTDRGIYRPGQTIETMALLRTQGTEAVDGAALTLILRRPDGVEARRFQLPPAPDAGFMQAIPLSATAAQGAWTVEAYTDPTLPAIGRASVSVQDFVPQQLKVTVTAPAAPLQPGVPLSATIDGRFLYGAPAAGLHAEASVTLVRDDRPVADAAGYSFGRPDETIPDATQTLDVDDADAQGHASISAPIKVPDVASPLRAELSAGLVEPGGRPVLQTVPVKLRTRPLLIGVKPLFGERVDFGAATRFDVRAFDAAGTPVKAPGLHWRINEVVTHWDWWRGPDRTDGPWTFHVRTEEVSRADGVFDIAAASPSSIDRSLDWGDYRLHVTDPATGAETVVPFSVGWGGGTPAANVPDKLDVSTDRAQAGVGQTVRVHVQGPFAGTATLIVESAGRTLAMRRVDLPPGGADVPLVASDDWGAGVHVLVDAIRPLSARVPTHTPAHTPVRAVGLAWIALDPAPRTLAVTIDAPAVILPRRTVRVPVHVTGAQGRAFVTLAAVDEGILQLTRFASPDPLTLLGRTRFGLELRDDYGRLLRTDADVGALREGGDAEALGGAGLPVTTTRTVALFQGPLALDAKGDAVVSLDVPDFAGELRLMAVAYDHDRAGHAAAAMQVRDRVVTDLGLPRFLAPDDAADVTISLNNTDGPDGDYHLALATSGAVSVRGVSGVDLHLAPHDRQETRVSLFGREAGIGHVRATLTGPAGLQVAHEWDIAVRSANPPLTLRDVAAQGPGQVYAVDVATLLKPFIPGSAQVTLSVDSAAGIDVPGILQSLWTYPYGCTEQTISVAFPLLYYSDPNFTGRMANAADIRRRVQDAVGAIQDRQDSSGRFGLWRAGDDLASVWLNVYALDFLLHAREAGFGVEHAVTDNAARWIATELASGADTGGSYDAPHDVTRAYAAYVLAQTDRFDPWRLRALAGDVTWNADARGAPVPQSVTWRSGKQAAPALALAQLAGAESLMGLPSAARLFQLALANIDAAPDRDWGWMEEFYWTKLRDVAGTLAVAAETGHDAVAASAMAQLRLFTKPPSAMNTQEQAWLLRAAHALAKRGGTRLLAVDGAAPVAVKLPYALTPSGGKLSVANADNATLFRVLTITGAPRAAPPAMQNGFTLERLVYTLDGRRLDEARLRQTDRFVVELHGAMTADGFRRTMIVDPLPAGVEIEAPVVRNDAFPFLGELSRLRAHEQRDDRFLAALDFGAEGCCHTGNDDAARALGDDEFRVAYVARAVTPGRFVQGGAAIQDMYAPDVMARTGGGKVTVAPR